MTNQPPVWQSDEWKQARKELLADACQQCVATDRLSLVHLWKPPRYQSIKAKIEHDKISSLIEEGEIKPFDQSTAASDEVRKACPECQSINLRIRKTKQPPFVCNRCGKQFTEPMEIIIRDDFLYRKAYSTWQEEQLKPFTKEIDERVKSLQAKYNKQYRSGQGTTTMCGKCAFLWTQKGMKLCTICGDNYHQQKYEQCYVCYQQAEQVLCEKCKEVRIFPQPGGINICENCYEKMWDEMTQ